jgi:hypothetical protein
MMAYINDQMIFYHVPKTGGRWVGKAMLNGGLFAKKGTGRFFGEKEGIKSGTRPWGLKRQHSTPMAMLDRFKENRYQFCFVRRPFEWYQSYFCYRWKARKYNPAFPIDQYWHKDFEDFLLSVLGAYPGGFIQQVYKHFVGPENDWMDFVGRHEHLADDLVIALSRAGCEFDEGKLRSTPPVNTGAADPWFAEKIVASRELVGRVEEAERWVLETFYA